MSPRPKTPRTRRVHLESRSSDPIFTVGSIARAMKTKMKNTNTRLSPHAVAVMRAILEQKVVTVATKALQVAKYARGLPEDSTKGVIVSKKDAGVAMSLAATN